MEDSILIINFGSQYTQLIARRLREIGVYCEIFPPSSNKLEKFAKNAKGIILSGSPASVNEPNCPKLPKILFSMEKPILGICYGMQALAKYFGGGVKCAKKREFGHATLKILQQNKLFTNIDTDEFSVWMSHGDKLFELPPDFNIIAKSDNTPIAAMAHTKKPIYGLQFHPEVTHTKYGVSILKNFAVDICKCSTNWNTKHIIEIEDIKIKNKIGNSKVILGLSGGVDSSVVAALLHRSVGSKLTCIFVDTGLLRMGEGDKVMNMFQSHMGINVIRVNAKDRFLEALKSIDEPEEKRKIIGKLFIDIFEEEAKKIKEVKFLAQGTIYPDVIESAGDKTGHAHTIKSHHNVGGLPENMNLELIEPLRFLFKDEVKKLGLELGLPKEMLYRHPFPGPALAVRILGEVRAEYIEILKLADDIFIDELIKNGLYDKVSQAFTVFLPIKSVGVMGDGRRYDYVIALRAIKTTDFMTAIWARLPYEFLEHVSRRIVNEVKGISRVVYDISSKPPATIEWE